MARIEFTKMHGCGNDFMVIDNRLHNIILDEKQIKLLGDRKKSIGFDQLILINNSHVADFKIDFYNTDGTYAPACGNGSRCAARYLCEHEQIEEVSLEVNSRLIKAQRISPESYSVELGKIVVLQKEPSYVLDIGNIHMIFYVEEHSEEVLHKIVNEYHSKEKVNSVNINVVKIISSDKIMLQTWERGVGPTLACGTGAASAAFAGYIDGTLGSKVHVVQNGGDVLIEIPQDHNIKLTGPAEISYQGIIEL